MATMLLVLSALCLVSVLAWRAGATVAAPIGAIAAVAASFLSAPAGPLALPVALATGLVAAVGVASTLGLLHPPAPQPH
ncbi:MAG: hypothetical protein ABIS47_08780 [Acidimicrobiales bacterium]